MKKSAKKTKVPVKDDELKAVHLVCPNCGAEETRVIYCDECDTPMEVVDVLSMEEDEAKGNAGVKHDINGHEDEEEEVVSSSDIVEDEEDVMENGLGEIFPGEEVDGVHGLDEDDMKGFENIEDVVSALDEE